jgi:hypothetical protein
MRDYLKEAALLMEIENHLKPFFPAEQDQSLLVNAHRALLDKIGKAYPHVDPFVFIVLRKDDPHDRKHPAGWGTHSYKTSLDIGRKDGLTTPELVAPGFDVYRYFHRLAATASLKQEPKTSLQRWLGDSAGHFYLVPYIVCAISQQRIDDFHVDGGELHDLSAWDDLLHTRPFSLNVQGPPPRQPSGAYFASTMMFTVRDWGVQSEPQDLLPVLEALFIQYQLSWSIPTLIKQKKDQMAKEVEQARLQQQLLKRGQEQARAKALVNGIVDRLNELSSETRSLREELGRGEAALFAAYQNASTFVTRTIRAQVL